MTATSLSVVTTAASGTVLPAGAAVDNSNGNVFTNTGREAMIVSNLSGGVLTVTIVTNGVYAVGTVNYAVADLAVNINNNTSKILGPFDKTLFNDANGAVDISWSSGTNVTAQVISLGTA